MPSILRLALAFALIAAIPASSSAAPIGGANRSSKVSGKANGKSKARRKGKMGAVAKRWRAAKATARNTFRSARRLGQWRKLRGEKVSQRRAERQRVAVGRKAASMIRSGTASKPLVVGLGTGRTATQFILALGERIKKGEVANIVGVATSERTQALAEEQGIKVVPEASVREIDIAVDGADEVDTSLGLIKGLGGALLREKRVARKAKRFVVIVDGAKLVRRLGEGKLPVEVKQKTHQASASGLAALGAKATLRKSEAGRPYVTDNGNYIVDVELNPRNRRSIFLGRSKEKLSRRIENIEGVVDHGLFLNMATDVLVGSGDNQVVHIER
jgi:ribose 5-phosphate isomerase A